MNYTILSTAAAPTVTGWQCFTAIESSPGHFKAYALDVDGYPTWEDVLATAKRGAKLSRTDALKRFKALSDTHQCEH